MATRTLVWGNLYLSLCVYVYLYLVLMRAE